MNISVYSRNKLFRTFEAWDVPRDFSDSIANYLVYGWEPGSCFTAVLANDFYRAMESSHPVNSVEAFKNLVSWIRHHMPSQAYGDYSRVAVWIKASPEHRRAVLEQHELIYTAKQETWIALKGEEELA
jgi:hypothetical protein